MFRKTLSDNKDDGSRADSIKVDLKRKAPPDLNNNESENTLIKEHYSGLRLKNQLVTPSQLASHMNSRRYIQLAKIKSSIDKHEGDIIGDWVTIALIAEKSSPRTASNGKKYCVMKMTDLTPFDASRLGTITVFLFEKSFERHWKEVVGSVVALLNPKLVPPNDTNHSYALEIDHPDKFLKIGMSMDFALCRHETCKGIINKEAGEYCEFHAIKAYKKSKLHRAEFAAATSNFIIGDPTQKAKKKASKEASYAFQNTTVFVGAKIEDESERLDSGMAKFKAKYASSNGEESKEALDHLMAQPTAGAKHLRIARNETARVKRPQNLFTPEQLQKMGYLPTGSRQKQDKKNLVEKGDDAAEEKVEGQVEGQVDYIELTDEDSDG
ncbi:hypothetical protein SmJEL517_g02319 [Synchytrium microbalum]|uniref:Uncharacterized protein n=1 Tax=Synchytrium microbalum TaxID=1806994 RepID=A0A507CBD7_9FUNG|nr:uncharacterized protein SmJEL517_g02319 [Synchytrium microbalum]TPX35316.1 hypothetical protein SmJEL517_g02319 [Synchytrium microbalum]